MKFFLVIISFLFHVNAFAAFDQTHSLWDKVLKDYTVRQGKQVYFKYKKLQKDSSPLDKYLTQLEALSEKEFTTFSQDQKLAFWLNAYNAYTIKLILDNYPLKSIKDINFSWLKFANNDWFTFGPWGKKFFKLFGKDMNLDNIEHDNIRKKFKEPRIHFAVNCASMGCPSLHQEAFVGAKLDTQLEMAAMNFLTNKKKNYLKDGTLYVSKIFKWYGTDFDEKHGTCIEYVIKTLKLPAKNYKVGLTEYDWKLNDID